MDPFDRVSLIRQRLQAAFAPSRMDVQDDSALHKGHAGSQNGAGHYTVIIEADSLKGLSRIELHRAIYQALNDMIPEQIHALQIKKY